MIAAETLLAITGLALLDSLNPATIVAVTLILLSAPRRAGLTALAAVAGAAVTVAAVGSALFLSAGAAAGAIDGIVVGLRLLAFGAAAVALIVSGIRRFRARARRPIALPPWFTAGAAIPFGMMLTAADLPNAFPYFIAIERMVSTGVEPAVGLLVILGYTAVYCTPCLILLVAGVLDRGRTRARLASIVERFGSGTVPRSIPVGIALVLAGIAVGTAPFLLPS
ncbi:GAP family protein [Microcella daejeonensis]|uniref:GAP family protein n=1 Tax=Microcella daejeonensis TaxID=2994971 RepID=UPI00227224FC|nr:GAP family protein [Microcella daejeonensis]WAB84637.1 GAP family protein [Microcella daejeonensis]